MANYVQLKEAQDEDHSISINIPSSHGSNNQKLSSGNANTSSAVPAAAAVTENLAQNTLDEPIQETIVR